MNKREAMDLFKAGIRNGVTYDAAFALEANALASGWTRQDLLAAEADVHTEPAAECCGGPDQDPLRRILNQVAYRSNPSGTPSVELWLECGHVERRPAKGVKEYQKQARCRLCGREAAAEPAGPDPAGGVN